MMSDSDQSLLDVYNLKQFFGGDFTIVIPDIQRDYCWGCDMPDDHKSACKITLFVDGLISLYRSEQSSNLGLIYGYSYPSGSHNIMVIDGQQRITTLFLLVGMLYRRTASAELRHMLINDYELIDDWAPRLVYQTRTEAMYFLSDLVINFFLCRSGRLSQLKQSSWYYKSYDSDPTVQSFIGAIRSIDACFEAASAADGLDFDAFAHFVVNRLRLTYHDLQSREVAEMLYVTINTTGEPLTQPQILRSRLMAEKGDSAEIIGRWEEMEQWAWTCRDKSDGLRPLTSDQRLTQFLELYAAHCGDSFREAFASERFDSLYRYFTTYRQCAAIIPDLLRLDVNSHIHRFLLLPTIALYRKFPDEISSDASLLAEFYSFLSNFLRYIKPAASGADTEAMLRIVSKMTSPRIESIGRLTDVSDKLINSDVRATLDWVANSGNKRSHVLSLIERAQAHPLTAGRISAMLLWCVRDGKIDADRFKWYTDYIYEIWGEDINCRADLDILRRALLIMRHPGFPIVRRGDICLSLCWHEYDWQRLYSVSPRLIRAIIDRVAQSSMLVPDTLRQMANKFNDRTSPYYFLIKDPAILDHCKQRLLIRPSAPFIGYYLQDNAYRMQWYVDQIRIKVDYERWNTLRAYGTMSIYTDHRTLNLSISIFYVTGAQPQYRIELFSRDDTDRQPCDIPAIARSMGYTLRYDKRRRRSYASFDDLPAALAMFRRVTSAF